MLGCHARNPPNPAGESHKHSTAGTYAISRGFRGMLRCSYMSYSLNSEYAPELPLYSPLNSQVKDSGLWLTYGVRRVGALQQYDQQSAVSYLNRGDARVYRCQTCGFTLSVHVCTHMRYSLNSSRSLRQVPGVRVVAWVYHIGRASKSLAGAVFRPLQAYLTGPGMRQIFYEKNLDFLRGHLNILVGLRASTHAVLDAWQESKSWFCHRKLSFSYNASELCRQEFRDWFE